MATVPCHPFATAATPLPLPLPLANPPPLPLPLATPLPLLPQPLASSYYDGDLICSPLPCHPQFLQWCSHLLTPASPPSLAVADLAECCLMAVLEELLHLLGEEGRCRIELENNPGLCRVLDVVLCHRRREGLVRGLVARHGEHHKEGGEEEVEGEGRKG